MTVVDPTLIVTDPAPVADPDPDTPDVSQVTEPVVTDPPQADPTPDPNVQKLIRDRQKANREAATAKKRLAELEAAETKRKDAELTELDLLKKQKTEAENALIAKNAEVERANNVNAALGAGVNVEYTGYIAAQLEAARVADPSLDTTAWLGEMKEAQPAFFGAQKVVTPAPPSAGGGPAPINNSPEAKQIKEYEAELKALSGKRGVREEKKTLARNIRILKEGKQGKFDPSERMERQRKAREGL